MTEHTFEEASPVIAELANTLARHVLPLFIEPSTGKPALVGNCCLISCGNNSYLVSAAHVFDELENGHELFFYIDHQTKRKLSGSGRLTKVPDGKNRKADRLDIGVLKLEGPCLPPYPNVDKYALSIGALTPNALPREGKQYLVVGFPETKSRANPIAREIPSKLYSFRNASVPFPTYADLDVSPHNHIVLRFDRENFLGTDTKVRAFPEPSGMSGCPVWLLFDENGPNDPSHTPMVGIAIEHHKIHRAIVATDIDVVRRLIHEDF